MAGLRAVLPDSASQQPRVVRAAVGTGVVREVKAREARLAAVVAQDLQTRTGARETPLMIIHSRIVVGSFTLCFQHRQRGTCALRELLE